MTRTREIAAGTLVVVLALSSCGKIAEKAVEKATGCEKIDLNDKGAVARCNGNSIDLGGNAKVPEGFPSELNPPRGSHLYAAIKSAKPNEPVEFNLSMMVPGTVEKVADALRSQLKSAHYTITDDSLSNSSSGSSGTITARNDHYKVEYGFGGSSMYTGTTIKGSNGTWVQVLVTELTEDERNQPASSATTTSRSSGSSPSNGSSGTIPEGKLPEGFPSSLAPPDDAKIIAATSNTSSGTTSFSVTMSRDGAVSKVYADLKQQVGNAGYNITDDSMNEVGGYSAGQLRGSNDTYDLTATVSAGLGTSGTLVMITLTAK